MLGRDEGLPHQPPWRADHSVGGLSRTGLRKPADPEPPSGRASCARRRRAVRIRGLCACRPLRERADASDGGGDRGTAGREPQREMTILEVLVLDGLRNQRQGRDRGEGIRHRHHHGAAGLIVAVGEPRCACRRCPSRSRLGGCGPRSRRQFAGRTAPTAGGCDYTNKSIQQRHRGPHPGRRH